MKRSILCTMIMGMTLMGTAHPLHLSVTNITLENGKLHIVLKSFPDDWEVAYFHYHGDTISLKDPASREDPWLMSYLNEHFRIAYEAGAPAIPLHKDTLIHEDDSMTLELSAKVKQNAKTLYIYQSLLTDIYPDQSNLVLFMSEKKELGIKFDVRKIEELVLLN